MEPFPVHEVTKKVTTTTIIIMPPRKYWDPIQQIRIKNDFELRTGPHITLVYPFVPEKLFPQVIELLEPVLRGVTPFRVTVEELDIFDNDGNATLFLKPAPTPVDAIHKLQETIGKVLPNCRDVEMITDNGFTPHMAIGGFGGKDAVQNAKDCAIQHAEYFKTHPITFPVAEIYLCSRSGSDPFEVKHVFNLNAPRYDLINRPYFGPKSPAIPNILYIGNLPRTNQINLQYLKNIFPTATQVQLIMQPDGITSRGCAWVTYATTEEAHSTLNKMTRKPFKIDNTNSLLIVKLASAMSYP
eukprot:TRINITY_DN12612_c0_g1_i1.p1 TRINITY_DN12612_c0_g1~~TRINITY_DN12612_c0_g1_i1.p1  ORF type:complete len:299 (-),score=59.04 TRINITY_DN12612_c0_g1_i1:118-1014(-)